MSRRPIGSMSKAAKKSSTIEKLSLLRNFVDGSWTETELTDCLRECGFNVERAAELLMTGEYKKKTVKKKGEKSTFFSLAAAKSGGAPPPATSSKKLPTTMQKAAPQKPKQQPPRKHPSCSSSSSSYLSPVIEDLTENRWLLCQRWISDAVCTARNSSVAYQEPLQLTSTQSGHPCVRFRGNRIEGRLPENLAMLLSPVMRIDCQPPMLALRGHALMAEDNLPTGAPIPISISVYLTNPRAFFEIFETVETNVSHYFSNNNNKSKSKQQQPLSASAFGLLQWAEHGDSYEFAMPATTTQDGEGASGDDDDMEMKEDDFETDEASAADAKELDDSITSDWAMSLPEADDPTGFSQGVSLRPYQKQALYWMLKREEEGESREELEKQLGLLAELAATSNPVANFALAGKENAEIVCDRGPVCVSEAARKRSKTLDGEVNPVNHPLWKQRFLASSDMTETVCFYINELLGTATHQPPKPPTPCSGGILADSMGLGKTVMLMALMVQSKEKAKKSTAPSSTLVVAKLSLLPQWEAELQSKTSLSYLVYYGQQGSRVPSVEDMQKVDVVLTTYGTIQGQLKSKRPTILDTHWKRVILDEAHCIRNQQTLASKVCCALNADHRWCVSGTIIQNSLEDVFGIMKFLKHEPWSLPSFWKAAVTKPMTEVGEDEDARKEKLALVLDRVRRMLSPLMIRRTKDSVTKDGKPILVLPPVEVKEVRVDLTECERDFYNAVLARSSELFDDFVEQGTVTKSYFKIFSLLSRLRQCCDHIALTVRSKMSDDDWNAGDPSNVNLSQAATVKENPSRDGDQLETQFMEGLLRKFAIQSSPKKRKSLDGESPAKRSKDDQYLSQVALSLTEAIQSQADRFEEECPICCEQSKFEEAVITPCGHVFCRECLVGFLRKRAVKEERKPGKIIATSAKIPDGDCPVCKRPVEASRIIALTKKQCESEGSVGGATMTTQFLTDIERPSPAIKHEFRNTQEVNSNALARQILEDAVSGADSSKMIAVMQELDNVWSLDPGSKVLIFSHYLGFLDLLETRLRNSGIPLYRLDGSQRLNERMVVLEEFRTCSTKTRGQSKSGTVLLMSMGAGGEGLNLVAASTCFICEPWWNAAREDQCVNRIHRIGQTAPVVRVRKFIVNDSVEERILELQGRKKYMADEVYEGGSGKIGGGQHLGLEDFKLMFDRK